MEEIKGMFVTCSHFTTEANNNFVIVATGIETQ